MVPRAAAAADRRRHLSSAASCSPRSSTAAPACSAASCRSGAAGGWPSWRSPRFALLAGTIVYAGASIGAQFESLRVVVAAQLGRLMGWAESLGLVPGGAGSQMDAIGRQPMGSLGQLTSAVGTALGAVSSLAMILVIGIVVAIEPRLYERGVAWLLPLSQRRDFYDTARRMGRTLRLLMAGRLLGRAIEGVFTALFAWLVGILGLALADPIVAMHKVLLEERTEGAGTPLESS